MTCVSWATHELVLHAVLLCSLCRYTAEFHSEIFIASEAEHPGPIKSLFLGFESLLAVCTYVPTPTPSFRMYKYAA